MKITVQQIFRKNPLFLTFFSKDAPNYISSQTLSSLWFQFIEVKLVGSDHKEDLNSVGIQKLFRQT